MTSGNKICTLTDGDVVKKLELDFLVTHHIGIWGISLSKFLDHIVDHLGVILSFKIKNTKINIQFGSHTLGVSQILRPRAFHTRKILRPVLHIDPDHMIASIFK